MISWPSAATAYLVTLDDLDRMPKDKESPKRAGAAIAILVERLPTCFAIEAESRNSG